MTRSEWERDHQHLSDTLRLKVVDGLTLEEVGKRSLNTTTGKLGVHKSRIRERLLFYCRYLRGHPNQDHPDVQLGKQYYKSIGTEEWKRIEDWGFEDE